jgi:hypothetical protein
MRQQIDMISRPDIFAITELVFTKCSGGGEDGYAKITQDSS